MSKSVWVVTSGEYSDYSIEAIFSDEVLAIGYAAGSRHMNQPDEWELDEEYVPLLHDRRFWRVTMESTGDSVAVELPASQYEHDYDSRWCCASWLYGKTGGDFLIAHIVARDMKHAVKIANEWRVRLIAENRWPGLTWSTMTKSD